MAVVPFATFLEAVEQNETIGRPITENAEMSFSALRLMVGKVDLDLGQT
jgi:hypothetical protein